MARLFVSAATWKAFDQVTLTISVTGWDDGLPCRGLALENFTVHQAPGVFDDPFRDGRNWSGRRRMESIPCLSQTSTPWERSLITARL
jgi:hypothetical protein